MAMSSEGAGEAPRPTLIERLRARLGIKTEQTLRRDIEGALADEKASAQDVFSPEERAMLRNILGLREVRVEDVMVPRADIAAVEHEISIGDLLKVFQDARHSRLPVYRETLDDPVGMVHIRDFLAYLTTGAPRSPRAATGAGASPIRRSISPRSTSITRSPRPGSRVPSCSCRHRCRPST